MITDWQVQGRLLLVVDTFYYPYLEVPIYGVDSRALLRCKLIYVLVISQAVVLAALDPKLTNRQTVVMLYVRYSHCPPASLSHSSQFVLPTLAINTPVPPSPSLSFAFVGNNLFSQTVSCCSYDSFTLRPLHKALCSQANGFLGSLQNAVVAATILTIYPPIYTSRAVQDTTNNKNSKHGSAPHSRERSHACGL